MTRNQIVFFIIIGVALLIVAAGLGMQSLTGNNESSDNDNNQNTTQATQQPVGNPLTIQVAVNELAATWIKDAARAYNETSPIVNNRPVTISVVDQSSLAVWSESTWSAADHPAIWIPEAGYVLDYAEEVGIRYTASIPSLAQTPIIWGVYESRATVIGELTATSVQQAAASENWQAIGGNSRWGFVKLAFPRPDRYQSGLSALITLVYDDNPTISDLSDSTLHTWLEPIVDSVPNFSSLGADPARVIANRGTSTADLGLLPESQWLLYYSNLNNAETIILTYPEHYVLLDFPFAVWSDDADVRRAAESFGEFLQTPAQQRAAGEQGLRPSNNNNLLQLPLFKTAEAQIQVNLIGEPITPPNRQSIQNLLRWFSNYRTAP